MLSPIGVPRVAKGDPEGSKAQFRDLAKASTFLGVLDGFGAPGRPWEPSGDIVGAKLDPERNEKREGASGGECDKTERDAGGEREKGKPCDRRRPGGPSRSPRDPRGGRRGEKKNTPPSRRVFWRASFLT